MKRCILVLLLTMVGSTTAFAQAGAAPPAPPKPSLKEVRKLRLRFRNEPTVRQTLDAALRFFRVHPEVVKGYRTAAALKALVPEIDTSFDYGNNNFNRNTTDAIYAARFPVKESETSDNASFNVGVRARWSLDRLVFNAEVLDVISLVGIQEGLLREITSLYFTRRRLMTILALSPPQEPFEKITEKIRLDEIGANLDALTGGFFSKELKKRFPDEQL